MKVKSYFGIRIHFKNGKNSRVTYFKTPEEAQSFFNDKKGEFAAFAEDSIVADTLTHYEDDKVEISIEDAFFPA